MNTTEQLNDDTDNPPSTMEFNLKHQQEVIDAMNKMAEAAEKSVRPQSRAVIQDDAVWLNIYCAVASCFNSEKSNAVSWADAGLSEFKKRF